MSTLVAVGPPLAVALVLLVLLACATSYVGELGHRRGVVVASVRAVLQLSLIALVLAAIVRSLALSLLFVLAMYVIASGTAARRLVPSRCGWWVALPIGAGALPVVALVVGLGVVPLQGVALVPIAGILIGNAMTGAVLAGRRGLDELQARRGEVEAGLAIGLPPREAGLMVSRPAAAEAMVPSLDATRTVGLVALPGTFVGTLLGGASPLEAGAVQVLILVAVVAVQAVAVVLTVELLARGVLRRP